MQCRTSRYVSLIIVLKPLPKGGKMSMKAPLPALDNKDYCGG